VATRLATASTRLALLALIAAGGAAGAIALAPDEPAPVARPSAAPQQPERATLVVPDVRSQAYVFAKGELEELGLGWRVVGPVQGYPGNVVVGQRPEPGTVVDPQAPTTVILQLARNKGYSEVGQPENSSPSGSR
jgi:hypothetical protein